MVAAVNRKAGPKDRVLTAAGGLPGELVKNWRVKSVGTFDCEFGFSCMGYEIAGGFGAKMATPDADVLVMVGDGSYLMMNSDIYSSVITGHKLIVVVCDNGGYAVIDRLQNFKGVPSFNNMFDTSRTSQQVGVDFAKHAESMGARAETVIPSPSWSRRSSAPRQPTAPTSSSSRPIRSPGRRAMPGGTSGVPAVSERAAVRKASAEHAEGKKKQRLELSAR